MKEQGIIVPPLFYFSVSGTLMHPELKQEICNGCGNCVEICPSEVYQWADEKPEPIDPEECVECGACEHQCPVHAIVMVDD